MFVSIRINFKIVVKSKTMKKVFFIACVIGLAIFPRMLSAERRHDDHRDGIPPTHGDAPAASPLADLTAIKSIQNNASLTYLDELQRELAARRSLLSKTILCAETDAKQTKTNLDNTAVDPSLENLKNQWSDRLSDAISYYDLQLQRVNEAGISGTESIAKEVLAWRENNYAPLAENVLQFHNVV